MQWTASEVAAAVGGTLVGPDVTVTAVTHDSREVVGGELFVPLRDVRDGHDFVGAAIDAGAAAYLTAREPLGATAIVVDDPARALAALGAAARRRVGERVVGITGSVGKTSCKDLTASVLGRCFETAASLRSFNNEIGVPLTLANAPEATEALVVEMGARGPGHIAELCAVARPTVGIVTTVAHVHTELFGDLGAVAEAKGELVAALPPSGTAVLNGANPLVAAMAARSVAAVVRFGVVADDAVWAEDVVVADDLRASFRLRSPWGDVAVRLGVRGEHQVANALAAAAAGLALGVPLADVAEGLGAGELSPWRMELARTRQGATVLNDAYNAGPASMEAALRSLAHLPAVRRIAVLGPMAELGTHGPEAHRGIVALAASLGIGVVAVAAPDYGDDDGIVHVADRDAALDRLGVLGEGDVVLVKGSRVAGLERLAAALLDG